jgi:folate-binding protein YgfZ
VGIPDHPFASIKIEHPVAGELYLVNHPRLQIAGADLFVPVGSLAAVLDKLITAATSVGGGLAGWEAFEIARIEAGIPRFGVDMDETNLAPEAGIESRAISYTKGCYIGQEVLNRLHTFAQANKRLCRLRFAPQLPAPPKHGTRLFKEEREAGQVTSSTCVPDGTLVGMGYLRKEWLTAGEEVLLPDGTAVATLGIVE